MHTVDIDPKDDRIHSLKDHSFSDNSFVVGEVESYNEVTFKLKMKMKVPNATPLEIKMNYEQKGRKGVASSLLEIV